MSPASAGCLSRCTAITMSAPICRTTSVGKLFTNPPSTYTCCPSCTGENAPGIDSVARSASASDPSLNTNCFALTKSVATQNLVPIEPYDQILHFLGANSRGIKTADQPAHAGPRDVVHRNVLLLEPLQHANVRQPQRTSALQCHAYFQPPLRRRRGRSLRSALLLRGGENGKHEQHKEGESAAHRGPPGKREQRLELSL